REDNYAVSIVGSRQASIYGLEAAERFSRDLAGLGFTVVSGLARGIDTGSHKAAIKAGGRTIAVMGSGFGHIYPAENRGLAEEIAQNGAVISEFPVATSPARQNFPRRNRIISGLALGVLVVEAARNSGALITADFALEQGRDVFALPGKVDSLNSFGTNGLIRQGAQLVCSAEDIADELKLSLGCVGQPVKNSAVNAGEAAPEVLDGVCALSCAETLLYNIISIQPVSLDDILERTNLGIPELSPALLNLELRKMIKQLPGKQFIRRDHGK
ncbi:MAG: DNA-processing protein DprA, partial [Candidatus Omnitrophota bacterium]